MEPNQNTMEAPELEETEGLTTEDVDDLEGALEQDASTDDLPGDEDSEAEPPIPSEEQSGCGAGCAGE